jgi:ubiquinone/menaquinone biosynthesis C-methylase UbiE
MDSNQTGGRMHNVDYNEICKIYDDARKAEIELINSFLQEITIDEVTNVLDIGCGTGNYTDLLQKVTHANIFGVEPSEGMIQKAQQKNPHITFKLGDAAHLPFDETFFDFVYMTDVIHHVPDIEVMFTEIYRVVKPGGKVCIVTQSHEQIKTRPIVQFFPGTVTVDKGRYPDIDEIIRTAEHTSFRFIRTVILGAGEETELDSRFLELAKKKGYSMLHLISDEEYQTGLQKLEEELQHGNIKAKTSGETLVWLENSPPLVGYNTVDLSPGHQCPGSKLKQTKAR